MSTEAYQRVITAPRGERRDLFLATARRLGTPLGNVEKDFWVCWTLDVLYNGLPRAGPRLLFKGGTALSKAHGLIQRFSEDIDVTVFRDDLDQPARVEELEKLSGKRRQAKLDAIRDACRAYISGPLREALHLHLAEATGGAGRVELDPSDAEGQTLLVAYPSVEVATDAYVRPVVRIESGAKSALDPHHPARIRPYVANDLADLDLAVDSVTTIDPERTFWDKIVIAHGLRRWYERRGVLRQEGQRISRHYYDLYCLSRSEVGRTAVADATLGADCVRHAKMFFNRPDFDLASATRGTFALAPVGDMTAALRRDYTDMAGMIFGPVPTFDAVLGAIGQLETNVNA